VGVSSLLGPEFIRSALLAGLPIAAAAGLTGYFLVLRSQVFTGDALSHVAFTGALGALAVGLDPAVGVFAGTIAAGGLLALLGQRGRAGDVAIGATFGWILGLGVLALSLYSSSRRASGDGAAGARVLFGSIFGLDRGHALLAALVGTAVVVVLAALGRPLLFASLDPAVATARGLPVTALGVAFLMLVGATAAVATQAMGALLILGLLAAPAGAAHRLTSRPYLGMALSTGIAVCAMAAGIVASRLQPDVPPSFAILAAAAGCYLAAYVVTSGSPGASGSWCRSRLQPAGPRRRCR
jgi:zinc/manganese transport system permease protein